MMDTNEKRHDYIYMLHLFVCIRDKTEEKQRVEKKTTMRRKLKKEVCKKV